jgi:hypothetical protein
VESWYFFLARRNIHDMLRRIPENLEEEDDDSDYNSEDTAITKAT